MTSLVRPRSDDDLARLAAILPVVHESDGYPVRASACTADFLVLPPGGTAWTAELDGVPVGQAMLTTGAHTGIPSRVTGGAAVGAVARLFVDPAARGHGLARALLDTVVGTARETGLRPMLEVVQEHHRAIALYERLGWSLVGTGTTEWLDDTGSPRTVRYYAAPDTA